MTYCGRFSGKDAAAIYQAFGCEADNPVVEICRDDHSLSVKVYENSGATRLIADNEGNLTLREWDGKHPLIVTTIVTAKGDVTKTIEKNSKRDNQLRELRRHENMDYFTRQRLREIADNVLPLARRMMNC